MVTIGRISHDYTEHALSLRKGEKNDPLGRVVEYDVHFVPAFIILRKDHELGRIIEQPKIFLEVDLVEVLSKASSSP